MDTNHDAGSATNHHSAEIPPNDQRLASGAEPSPDAMVAIQHGEKWADFYDSLDQLVHEQFDRSNELLRDAISLLAIADEEVAAIRRQAAERVAAERRRRREILLPIDQELTEMAGELAQMQQRMTQLASRLEQTALGVKSAIQTVNREEASSTAPPTPPRAIGASTDGSSGSPASDSEAAPDQPRVQPAKSVSQLVVVHGVRQARTALSLQRYLYGMAGVEGVDSQECQDGILQLRVRSMRELGRADFQSWDDGAGLQIDEVTEERIEARLPEPGDDAGHPHAKRWWGSRATANSSANGKN